MKTAKPVDRASTKPRRRREPLEMRLSVRFKFGDAPDEVVTMIDDRRVPMVEGVFSSRDRIIRGFVSLLLRAGAAQPKVARELIPLLRVLKRGKGRPL